MVNPITATINAGSATQRPVVRVKGYGAGTVAGVQWRNAKAFPTSVTDPASTIPNGTLGQNLCEIVDSGTNPATFNGANALTAGGGVAIASGKSISLPDTFRCYSATAFTGVIASNVLTASSVTGTLAKGQTLWIGGTKASRHILMQLTGTAGGAGTYLLTSGTDVASTSMAAHHADVLIAHLLKYGSQPSTSSMKAFGHLSNTGSTISHGAYVNGNINAANLNFGAAGASAQTMSGNAAGTIYLIGQQITVNADGTRRSRLFRNRDQWPTDHSAAFTAWPSPVSPPLIGYKLTSGDGLADGFAITHYQSSITHLPIDGRAGIDVMAALYDAWFTGAS